jgi:hypothetical protein
VAANHPEFQSIHRALRLTRRHSRGSLQKLTAIHPRHPIKHHERRSGELVLRLRLHGDLPRQRLHLPRAQGRRWLQSRHTSVDKHRCPPSHSHHTHCIRVQAPQRKAHNEPHALARVVRVHQCILRAADRYIRHIPGVRRGRLRQRPGHRGRHIRGLRPQGEVLLALRHHCVGLRQEGVRVQHRALLRPALRPGPHQRRLQPLRGVPGGHLCTGLRQ